MTLGQKIRKLRKTRGLSQVELAQEVGMNSSHLSRIERGTVQPSTELLKRLARALDASADYSSRTTTPTNRPSKSE